MKRRAIGCHVLFLWLLVPVLVLGTLPAFGGDEELNIVVNRVRLKPEEIQALARLFGTRMRSSRFWHDKVSGFWGLEGLPTAGQMYPGLNLGGLCVRRIRFNSLHLSAPYAHLEKKIGLRKIQYLFDF